MGRRNKPRNPAAAAPAGIPESLAGAVDDADVATLDADAGDAPGPGFSEEPMETYAPGRSPHELLAMEGMNLGRAAPAGVAAVPAGVGMADAMRPPTATRGAAPSVQLPKGDPETHRGLVLPKTTTPGIAAPRGGTPALPPLEFIHAADVCPELFPIASSQHPGMFIDRKTGRPVLPPLNNKPQYSALLLEIQNRLAPEMRNRWAVLAAHAPRDTWGVEEHELVLRRIEVVFDDEPMMREYMRRGGARNKLDDPLAVNSLGLPNYDNSPATVPGLLPLKAASPLD